MVPGAGIEPARLLEREILSLLCLPISPSGHIFKEQMLVYSISHLLSTNFYLLTTKITQS